ncbi:hypothetical protein [Paenibacillus sp. FSL H8-0259]|uniref:hypothetical protein n=1 Tax=Paenibacillus sp. FSL H8-0259 TaxID=1920423 RepID=UPI00096FD2E5|nr:hypothetical protein [Paenibacillus sp. FSL H8-0259]OMF28324.1 hypothetical protein BK132_14815 [Paenibacillus sp. FSL H8-0259]
MLVFKGDTVRTSCGLYGEVLDTWGIARPWAKLRKEDGELAFFLRTNVTEIVKRPPVKKGKR